MILAFNSTFSNTEAKGIIADPSNDKSLLGSRFI
jgi:hypothetical protein